MTTTEIINRALAGGFNFAFIPDPDWSTVAVLRKSYEVSQGWNNKYLTGYSSMQFGYIIKLK